MNIHYRCRKCGKRQVRPDVPARPLHRRRCSGCRRIGTLRVDKWAQSRGWRRIVCYCDQYPYPHSRNSRLCVSNPFSADNIQRAVESNLIGPEHFEEAPETNEPPF